MAEAVVIGGGVMGLAAARALRARGYSVSLLERGQPGRAASWASAGIIGATLRDESDPSWNLRRASRDLWPSFADQVRDESGLDPEYRQMGCIQLAADESELSWLRTVARRTEEAEFLDSAALRRLEPHISAELAGGLLVAGGNVDNRRLCKALEIAARRAGVAIEAGVEVTGLASSGGRVSGVEISPTSTSTSTATSGAAGHASTSRRWRAADPSGTRARRAADLVVVAAGAWSAQIAGVVPEPPVRPQRGQILALDQLSVGVSHVLLTAGDPYFVPRADGRLVIGATREEVGWDPSLTAEGVAWLLNRATDVVPALKSCPIAEMWTGFRPLSADGLPLIGQSVVQGVYVLTGHGPSGIAPLPGSIALLMAQIDGGPTPLPAEPFDPLRFLPEQR